MKRVNLTEHELEVLETALANYGAVITFDQLSALFNENRTYTRKRISKLAQQGWLKRIKKGLFVMADLSSRGTLSISHLAIVNILVQEAYISFETALQHHGLFDQLHSKINSVSLTRYKTTKIDSITYNFIQTQQQYFYGWKTYEIDGQSVKIADTEKALIDLIQFHRSLYSTDLVMEKLRENRHTIKHQKLIDYGLKANLTTRRILGFLLDCASLDSSALLTSVSAGQSVSAINNSANNIYNHKWKLYYDQYFKQYLQEQIDQTAT